MFFLDCKVLICNFHREQAWERWTKKKENGVGEFRDEVLNLMRAISKAETGGEYEAALTRLQTHPAWTKNPKFQKYFCNVWLEDKEV